MTDPGASASPARPGLRRVLGTSDAAALVVGVMVGSGIFATPPLVAGHLPSPALVLGVWALGGVIALCGALSYAELAGLFPRTGGAYVFLREGYGRFPAFAYGWSALLVTYPASVAAVSLVFAAYLARLVPALSGAEPVVASALCLSLAGLNLLGVRLGAWFLRLTVAAKVLALLAVVTAGLFVGGGAAGGGVEAASPLPPLSGLWAAGALALVAVLWTYEGWADGPTLAGEVRDPGRDMARALVLGVTGVAGLYLLANLSYLRVLGVEGMRGTDSVATDLAERVFGSSGVLFVNLLVIVSTLGAASGMVLGASRIVYALARDGLSLDRLGEVHSRWHTPAWALTGVGLLSAAYAWVGTFEEIIRVFVLVATVWFVLNIASVFLHRHRRPLAPRPFRIPLYPLPPLLYLAAALALLFEMVRADPRQALGALGVLVVSIPAYLIWEKRKGRHGVERMKSD
jgi:amino acid transporter